MKNKLIIGDVKIVRIGNEIRYNVPEDMTGAKLNKLKEAHKESIGNFVKSSKL
jgi:hypothetical protein